MAEVVQRLGSPLLRTSEPSERAHFFSLDLIKGLAIISVVSLHLLPDWFTRLTGATFHMAQAVPIFLVIMGFLTGLSLAKYQKRYHWKQYTLYLRRRTSRLFWPFLICWLASLVLGLVVWVGGGTNRICFGLRTLLGYLPVTGPGNYFVSILLQAVLLLPWMVRCFRRYPILSLVTCFLINLGFELIAAQLSFFEAHPLAYSACLFRYFAHIGLGIWLSLYPDIFHRRNRFILWSAPASIAYLAWLHIAGQNLPIFRPDWRTHNLIAVFYPTLLVLAGMKWLPSAPTNFPLKAIALCGIASYHIFLFQMLWFGFGGDIPLASMFQTLFWPAGKIAAIGIWMVFSLVACLGGGVLWWRLEELVRGKLSTLPPAGFTPAR